jgi:zinc transporter
MLTEPDIAKTAGASVAPLLGSSVIPGLVWAFRLHHDGSAEQLPIDAPVEFTHDGRLWLHFNLADTRVRSWLADANLPLLARELLLSSDNFQQLHILDDCVYGVFSDLVRDIDAATEETGFLRFAMTERLLISGRHQALCAADAARRVLEGGYRVKHVAALLEKIVDEVADTMDRMADKIGTEIDEIEEKIVAGEVHPDMRNPRPAAPHLPAPAPAIERSAHAVPPAGAAECRPSEPGIAASCRAAGATARRPRPRHRRIARAQPAA